MTPTKTNTVTGEQPEEVVVRDSLERLSILSQRAQEENNARLAAQLQQSIENGGARSQTNPLNEVTTPTRRSTASETTRVSTARKPAVQQPGVAIPTISNVLPTRMAPPVVSNNGISITYATGHSRR